MNIMERERERETSK